jgi:hypothetical protein
VGAALIYVRTEGRMDMTEVIGVFREYANAPNKRKMRTLSQIKQARTQVRMVCVSVSRQPPVTVLSFSSLVVMLWAAPFTLTFRSTKLWEVTVVTEKFCENTKHILLGRRFVSCSECHDTQNAELMSSAYKKVFDGILSEVRSHWSSTTSPRGRDSCISRQTLARSPATTPMWM